MVAMFLLVSLLLVFGGAGVTALWGGDFSWKVKVLGGWALIMAAMLSVQVLGMTVENILEPFRGFELD